MSNIQRKGSASLDSNILIPARNLPACIGKIHAAVGDNVNTRSKVLSYYYYNIELCSDKRFVPIGSLVVTNAQLQSDPLLQLRWEAQNRMPIVPELQQASISSEADESCLIKTKVWADLAAGVDGKLVRFNCQVGDWIKQAHTPVITVEETCGHDVVYLGMCAICGKDITQIDRNAHAEGAAIDRMRADIAVAHDEVRVRVSRREAERMDQETTQRLLKARKLSLILDLDQTIIHAAVDPTVGEWRRDPRNPNFQVLRDVHEFVLPESSCVYYVKLRPHTREFLSNLAQLYELHIYTMGTRSYANAIAQIIDPDGEIFKERILSRDENGSVTLKSLQRLFPCDQSMVVVVDDRADVWQWSPNLLNIPCYNFFAGVGDINSELLNQATEAALEAASADPEDTASLENLDKLQKRTVDSQIKERPLSKSIAKAATPQVLFDSDDQLLYIYEFLKKTHNLFFNSSAAEQASPRASVQRIVPYLKRNVLYGCRIVFSGIFPLGTDPAETPLGVTVAMFGATISAEVDKSVTHLVAARTGTTKVIKAIKLATVNVVHLSWLIHSISHFERQSENEYLLDSNFSVKEQLRPAIPPLSGLTELPTYSSLAGHLFRGVFPRDTLSLIGPHALPPAKPSSSASSAPLSPTLSGSSESVSPLHQLEENEWDDLINELDSDSESDNNLDNEHDYNHDDEYDNNLDNDHDNNHKRESDSETKDMDKDIRIDGDSSPLLSVKRKLDNAEAISNMKKLKS